MIDAHRDVPMSAKRFLSLVAALCVLASGGDAQAQIVGDGGFELPGYPLNGNIDNATTIAANGWTFGTEGGTGTSTGHARWEAPGSNGAGHYMEITSPAGLTKAYAQTTMTG